jgi:hypothetical protein
MFRILFNLSLPTMSIFFGDLNLPTSTFSTKISLVKLIKEADVAQMANGKYSCPSYQLSLTDISYSFLSLKEQIKDDTVA